MHREDPPPDALSSFEERIRALEAEVKRLSHSNREQARCLKRLEHSYRQADRRQAERIDFLQGTLNTLLRSPTNRFGQFLSQIFRGIRDLRTNARLFLHLAREEGLSVALHRSIRYFRPKSPARIHAEPVALTAVYDELSDRLREGAISGVAVIPSAFEFEPLYNQRTINFAKYLSDRGFGVLYVAWQWSPDHRLEKSYQNVYGTVFQIPLYDFTEHLPALERFRGCSAKYFICTFPPRIFLEAIRTLRDLRFSIAYDIMDDWEEFHANHQAPWYQRECEEAIVINADVLFAVSEPLRKKFSHLRREIQVIGNGYTPDQLGRPHLALKGDAEDGRIHLGYFGHLTEAWFDWDLVLTLLDQRRDLFFHCIGYGAPTKKLEALARRNNASYHGEVQPDHLANYVAHWHLGIIPFKASKLAEAVDPIKVYEYLYFGLPTLVTGIAHLGHYPGVRFCKDLQEILRVLEGFQPEVPWAEPQAVSAFLQEATWERRFQKMLDQMDAKRNFLGFLTG